MVAIAAGFAASPAFALDARRPPPESPVGIEGPHAPAPPPARARTPFEAFRFGARALRAGETAKGMTALEYAAENGHPAAQWKLGRMYADGDQVQKDDLRAFHYFSRVANNHADDSPSSPQSRYVASAFVALGQYYLVGIPDSPVKVDPTRAREMFAYAASYFGDPDAQYNLARMYLDGAADMPPDPRQAARWLDLAARKGQYQAQAVLGHLLFKGAQGVPRQAARGLMYLTLAREGAGSGEKWVVDLYDAAVKIATDDQRALALVYLERYMRARQE
jgi:TPR repeat protein